MDSSRIEMNLLTGSETSRSHLTNAQLPEKEKIDYFSKLFLKPIEIKLGEDNQNLVIVERQNHSSSRYTTRPVVPLGIEDLNTESEGSLLNWKEGGRAENKTLLQLYAATPKRHIRLAIVVCIYSEEQEFLNRTLSGILENYQHFVDDGISPQEIAVIFMFDGIEKVSSSAEDFFNKMDLRSNFKWKHYARDIRDVVFEEWVDEDLLNIYTEEEIEAIEPTLFCNRKKEHMDNKELLEHVRQLKKATKTLIYDDMPPEVQEEYVKALKAEYFLRNPHVEAQLKRNQAKEVIDLLENPTQFREVQADPLPTSFLLYYFESQPEIKHKCVCIALTEVELMLQSFFSSRDDTCFLYPYAYEFPYQKPIIIDNKLTTIPVNLDAYIFLCVKNRNAGKLSSQNWFFKGFCELFKPDCSILLDVGLKPAGDALYKMYKYLAMNPNCGGVCGYMGLSLERPYNDLGVYENQNYQNFDCLTKFTQNFFDIQNAQRFEYHFAHMLDKPFESFFDFINVLPGAFSGYNMDKLFKNNDVLEGYFKSLSQTTIKLHNYKEHPLRLFASFFLPRNWLVPRLPDKYEQITAYDSLKQKNVYLAEDRILCLGIFEQGMTMAFLPDAWATVDSVTSIRGLLGQRRRWINGSYFAFEKVSESSQFSCSRIYFALEMMFYYMNNAFSFISIALFFITLDLTAVTFVNQTLIPAAMTYFGVKTTQQLNDHLIFGAISPLKLARSFQPTVNFIYVVMLGTLVFMSLSLSQTNPKFERRYMMISTIMGWYSIGLYILMAIIILNYESAFNIQESSATVNSFTLRWMIYGALFVQALPPLSAFVLIRFDINYVMEVLSSVPSYIFYSASYLHLLNVFAYSRIDDVSWGTKGLTDDGGKQDQLKEAWETQKYIFISRYIGCNVLVAVILIFVLQEPGPKSVIIACFTGYVGASMLFRFLCGFMYLIRYKWKSPKPPSKDPAKFPDLKFRRIYYILKPEVMIISENKNDEDYMAEYLDFCKVNHIMGQRVLNADMARASVYRNVTAQRTSFRTSTRPSYKPSQGFRNSKFAPKHFRLTNKMADRVSYNPMTAEINAQTGSTAIRNNHL